MSLLHKRRGKSQASLEQIEACREILTEIQPASVRAVCYRLFTMGLISDMSKNSTNKVSIQLVYARENGLIPWGWTVDETREAERVSVWSDPNAIIEAAVKGYRRDYWQDQDVRVKVWFEKGTVRGTLAPVPNKLGVTFRVMHGFASATTVTTIAELSNESHKLSAPIHTRVERERSVRLPGAWHGAVMEERRFGARSISRQSSTPTGRAAMASRHDRERLLCRLSTIERSSA